MGAAGLSIAIKNLAATFPLSREFDVRAIPPTLVKPQAAPRRSKIWDFSTHLHCSIIGTCLSTGELRQVLRKLGRASPECSDHDLHHTAVSLAGRHDEPARQLHKALDRRHKLAVNQFEKAGTEDELRSMWREAVRRGDIPGAYWATLTSPLANQTIIREAFGEVHMLSHLVGSANRADIRRLCQLESARAELEAKLQRQQLALHNAVVTRDQQIQAMRQTLAGRIIAEPVTPEDAGALRGIIADTERRMTAESRRRASLEERLSTARASLEAERSARTAAERACEAMRRELEAVESSLLLPEDPTNAQVSDLNGLVLLYVGGRPNQVVHLRAVVERLGAAFLHHDGGVENHPNLLPGLASRAGLVLFPVDCISHEAANAVKSLCRQGGKRFIPLRSASMTSLLTALQAPEVTGLPDESD
jgi:Uncharacterized protein conserved in bacteria (DUF2325)